MLSDDDESSWTEHFLKGFASLGLLGFVKVFFTLSPWQWWNLRSSGFMSGSGGRAGATGRDRLANISWLVVVLGVCTVLYASNLSIFEVQTANMLLRLCGKGFARSVEECLKKLASVL